MLYQIYPLKSIEANDLTLRAYDWKTYGRFYDPLPGPRLVFYDKDGKARIALKVNLSREVEEQLVFRKEDEKRKEYEQSLVHHDLDEDKLGGEDWYAPGVSRARKLMEKANKDAMGKKVS